MKQKFEQIISEIKNNEFIKITRCEINDGLGEKDMNFMLTRLKVDEIPEIMMEFYSKVGFFAISWELNIQEMGLNVFDSDEDVTQLSGKITIRPIGNFLVEDLDHTNTFKSAFKAEDAKKLKSFRLIEFEDNYIFGLLQKGKKITDELMYIRSGSDGFGSTEGINLETYFDSIYKYRGFNGWQNAITSKDSDSFKRMEHYINQIF